MSHLPPDDLDGSAVSPPVPPPSENGLSPSGGFPDTHEYATRPAIARQPMPYTGSSLGVNPLTGYAPHASETRPESEKSTSWRPLVIAAGIIAALLIGMLLYQQMQITQLKAELGAVSQDVRSGNLRDRVAVMESQMGQVESRLGYLDSKINAVDRKAQASLNKWREQENRGNFLGDLWKQVVDGLGFGR